MSDRNEYKSVSPLTVNKSVAAEVSDAEFPKLLDPVDDLPPSTIVTSITKPAS